MMRLARETGASLGELETMDADRLLDWVGALAEQLNADAEASRRAVASAKGR